MIASKSVVGAKIIGKMRSENRQSVDAKTIGKMRSEHRFVRAAKLSSTLAAL